MRGHRRSNLAAVDPDTGALLPWTPASVGDVATILVTDGQVIMAGHDGFGATSARTGHGFSCTSRLGGDASAFGADGRPVYLGGDLRNSFRSVDGAPRNNLAAFNVPTGRFTSWAPDLARYVSVGAIVPSGGQVLVVGTFTSTTG